jgi:SulP family sulfate permease
MQYDADKILIAYFIGPLFFGTTNLFNNALENLGGAEDLILSFRTVPHIDTTGIKAVEDVVERVEKAGGRVYLSGLNDPVRHNLERAGVIKHLGEDRITWSAYEAIMAADHYRARGLLPIPAGEGEIA